MVFKSSWSTTPLWWASNPGGKIFLCDQKLELPPIFTTHFCQILPEPWEILRIYVYTRPGMYMERARVWQVMW